MDSQAFDHSPYHANGGHDLQSDLNKLPDLHDYNNLLNDPIYLVMRYADANTPYVYFKNQI